MGLFTRFFQALRSNLVIQSIGILALLVFTVFVIFEATQATVVVAQDGEEKVVKTHAKTVKDLLEELDITVSKHDALSLDLNTLIENGMEIEYTQAKRVAVTVDDQTEFIYTTANTVGEMLRENHLYFSMHDELSHDLSDEITDHLHLKVKEAFKVKIDDGGKEKHVWTTGGSVQDLLEENDIKKLGKHDKVKPKLDKYISEEDDIAIVRVTKEKEIVEEVIDYKVDKKEDNTLEKGKEKVIEEGEQGLVEKTYEFTYENKEKVDEEMIKKKVIKEPKNKVVAIGTKEKKQSKTKSTPSKAGPKAEPLSNNSSSGKEFTMRATAYTASCNGCSGITATGINLKENPSMNVIAVDPNVIPLGSRVWVEGYGEAIAGDTGGAITGHQIDVHVPTKADAHAFGTRQVKVKVLD